MLDDAPASGTEAARGEPGPRATYQARAARCTDEQRRLGALSRRISYCRLASFLAGAVSALVMATQPFPANVLWLLPASLGFVAFFALVLWHDRVIRREQRAADQRAFHQEGLARLERRWTELPVPAVSAAAQASPLARDLDLFGPASLSQLLGTARTPFGRGAIARWLLEPPAAEEVRRRQEAVRELAPKLDLREDLFVACGGRGGLAGGGLATASIDTEPFLAWAEGEPWLLRRRSLLWAARLLPVAGFALFGAALAGALPWSAWLAAVFLNLWVGYSFAKPVNSVFQHVEAGEGGFTAYGEALAVAVREPAASASLRALQAALDVGGPAPAHAAMARLARLVVLGDIRHSSLGYLIVQALFLWSFHVLARLERWQETHGRHARRWLTALGEVEALAALGSLSFENPEWCFPEIETGQAPRLVATGLGHPLLPPAPRVDNDVALGPPGTFLFVTGSNMSGKSTLLRALGANVVLAQAGGPACARALSLPPLELGTSLLIEDSLAGGVSFFLAELQRLKAILDAAASCHVRGATLLFLLDEVLRGTNSAERRIAVRRVLLRLAELGAIGAVTTHDLALAEDPAVAAAMQPVHFRETLHPAGEGPPMTFDYRLRPGLATTVNALRLLELVGIEGPG